MEEICQTLENEDGSSDPYKQTFVLKGNHTSVVLNVKEQFKVIAYQLKYEEQVQRMDTGVDGKTYNVIHSNLDMIISLGYRIKSIIATNFRCWATKYLKECMIKGFTMDDEQLK